MVSVAQIKELRELSGAGMSACKSALEEANGDIKRASEILREKGLAAAAKKAGRVAAEGLVTAKLSADRKSGTLVEVNSETDFVAKNDDFVAYVAQVAEQVLGSGAADVDALLAEKWVGDASQTVDEVLKQKISTIGENIGIRRFAKYDAGADSAVVEYIHTGGRVGVMLEIAAANISDAVLEAGRNVCMHIALMAPQYVSSSDMSPEDVAAEKDFITKTAMKENEASDKPKPAQVIEKMVEGRLAKSLKEICLVDQAYVKNEELTVAAYLKTVDANVKRFTRFERGEGIEKKEENFAEEVAKVAKG